MKTLLKLLVPAVILSMLAVSSQAAKPQTWKIGHVRPAGSAIDLDLRGFTETIEEASGGAIRFSIYPANKLGDYSVVQERVSFGEVEMYVGPFGTATDRRLMLAFTPFLVSDWQQARRLYNPSSPLYHHLQSVLEAQNIKLLGGWPVYFGGLGLTEKPDDYQNPESSKGLIIRVPPIRSFELTARSLGYTPYPITWMYAKMGLKTGMVQGLIGGGAEGYAGLAPMIRYYLPVRDHFEYWFLYINLETWNQLEPSQQELLSDAARELERNRYQVAEAEEQAALAELEKRGVEVLQISEAAAEAMRQKVRREVWPRLQQEIGAAFAEIRDFVENQ